MASRKKVEAGLSVEREKFQQELPIKLTEKEIIAASDDHVKKARELAAEVTAFDKAKADLKEKHEERAASIRGEMRRLEEMRDTHEKKQLVDCVRVFNFETNRVAEHRLIVEGDAEIDGEMIGSERAMDQHERKQREQMRIPGALPNGADTEHQAEA